MEPTEATTASEWKRGQGRPCRVRSGNIALVRPFDPAVFLSSGRVPNLLLPMLEDMLKHHEGGKRIEVDSMARVEAAMDLIDAVVVEYTAEPQVHPVPSGCMQCQRTLVEHDEQDHDFVPTPRDPDKLYVDQIDMDDKIDVYEFALSEAAPLIPFPEEPERSVDAVQRGEGTVDTTERPVRSA